MYFREVVLWIDICFCLPLTMLSISCVCCMGQRKQKQVPVIYHINLFIANLIHLCVIIYWVVTPPSGDVIQLVGAMASLYFKMCIALERYFFIICPQLDCLRLTKGSVLVCVLVWAFCIVSIVLARVLKEFVRLTIYAFLPAPLFLFCLARTFRALPAATSVPTEEKRRILGILVLLFINYFMINTPIIIIITFNFHPYYIPGPADDITFILFLLSSLLDWILLVFMWKGSIEKLLACLCCCSLDDPAAEVSSTSADVVTDNEREQTGSHDEPEVLYEKE